MATTPVASSSNNSGGHGQGTSYNANVGVNNPGSVPAAPGVDEYGVQTRTMGLKVHYTFDKEAKINCLARCPHALSIQTAQLDDKSVIGVIDLRTCVQSIAEGSPEIASQECDYSIYAVDCLEPDTPWVGYGLLSRTLDSLLQGASPDQPPRMVTGRVTRNLLGVFGGGNKETLEVRLKLSETIKVHRPVEHAAIVEPSPNRSVPMPMAMPMPTPMSIPNRAPPPPPTDTPMTPTGHTEWTSLVQSNPQIGQPAVQHALPRAASPPVLQGPPPPIERPPPDFAPSPVDHGEPMQEVQRIPPTPTDTSGAPVAPATSSRPSSRTSNRPTRRKQPTGRPRGRPRKKPAEGNTSGYEDGTEGEEPREEGPAKKRVKTTMVDKADSNPFSASHESLRVTASNSSSLRNFRPIAMHPELGAGSHLQEVPRAPTPVPQGRFRGALGQGENQIKAHHESRLGQPPAFNYPASFSEPRQPMSPSQDGRSPDSLAPTPNYSEGSPPDIGSSPPVRRTASFIRSSPPPSSPVLPPMPVAKPPRETGFANNDPDDLFGEEQARPPMPMEEEELPAPPPLPPARKEVKKTIGVPIQVYQIQDGPEGQDLVHIRSYTTPFPSSSAPGPADSSLQSPMKQDVSRSGRQINKRKKARAQAPAPQPPTPPPTTDAAEKPLTPDAAISPISVPTPVVAPVYETATLRPMLELEGENEHERRHEHGPQHERDPQHIPPVHSVSDPQPESKLPPRHGIDARGEPRNTSPVESAREPTPEPARRAAPAPIIDLSHDPVFQLAMSFGMSEVPAMSPSQSSPPTPPPFEGQLPHPQQPTSSQIAPSAAKTNEARPKHPRQLNRSQSAGPLTLPRPPAPVNEPSTLSRPPTTASEPSFPQPSAPPSTLRRAASTGPLVLPAPESIPIEAAPGLVMPVPAEPCPPSNSNNNPTPSSPPAPRSNKNIVKKHAIKQRLEQAIINGEMPPFCSNCGAIETPTWRKIWVQQKEGPPEKYDFSEKPGRVTAVEIIKRDADEKPTLHRIVKKSLAPADDRKLWQEALLCNPCGIWLSKCKSHRPADRWDKDLSRLGQERRRRVPGRAPARPKKPRNKDDSQAHPASEAYIATDGAEPVEVASSPKLAEAAVVQRRHDSEGPGPCKKADSETRSIPGSTHSRGTGTAQSPIDIDFDEAVGSTKRLLFPSPSKGGPSKALSDVDINTVQLSECQQPKELTEKGSENIAVAEQGPASEEQDDLESLFRSPPKERPSTPPPSVKSTPIAPFKTPTRPAASHRPITRSVSRSLRSVRSIASPSQHALERTPTGTPGAGLAVPGSNNLRRSPRNHQNGFEDSIFDTPISRRITQMLQQSSTFSLENQELEFNNMNTLDGQATELIDFGNLLDAEGAAPNSPSKQSGLNFDYEGQANFWPSWNLESAMDTKE